MWDNAGSATCQWDMTTQTEHLAVLFADISESTKLYGTLGDSAARAVITTCITLISEVVGQFRGRVVKTIGDEVMCVFRRADDAVLAAGEMQAQIDASRPGKYHVQIHIGLHYGAVIVEDGDVEEISGAPVGDGAVDGARADATAGEPQGTGASDGPGHGTKPAGELVNEVSPSGTVTPQGGAPVAFNATKNAQ